MISELRCRMELRLSEDRSADAAMVRLKHENVQLKAAAERAAAEAHQLRASRRSGPDGAHAPIKYGPEAAQCLTPLIPLLEDKEY